MIRSVNKSESSCSECRAGRMCAYPANPCIRYELIYTCDKCDTTNLPHLQDVKVGNILTIEVCDQCAPLVIDMIEVIRTAQSKKWFAEYYGIKPKEGE